MDWVREHSATVVSARGATVDWSWHKSSISVRELIKTNKKSLKNPCKRGKIHHQARIMKHLWSFVMYAS